MAFYGIPIEKKYPLNTEDEIRIAIMQFDKCPVIKRKILADNINTRIRDFDMLITLNDGNDFIHHIDKRFLADIANGEIRACYKNMCHDITKITHSTKSTNEYNKDVYDLMVKFAEETNDIEKLNDFLREGNEYADGVTRSMKPADTETLMILDIIDHVYESLHLVSLQYNVSKEYVNKLLTDLEEMYVELIDSYMVKRKIFALNQYNTRCITMKTDLNILIGKRTNDLLNGKFTMKSLGKMSSFMMRYGYGHDVLVNYFKDKQNELKEYYTMQNKYFFSGFSFHKSCLTGMNGDSYSMFETEMDIRHRGRTINELLDRFPKLTLEIQYSDIYRLQKKFKYIKQISIEGLSNVTIVSINEGNIYFVTKKKNGDSNVFYLVSYNDLLNMNFVIEGETKTDRWKKFTAMKVTLKSEDLSNDDFSTALESCTKF